MKEITPLRAIRKKCLECSNGQPAEIKECPIKSCALYDFRLGYKLNETGEKKKRETTEKHKEILRQRIKRAREQKNDVQKTLINY